MIGHTDYTYIYDRFHGYFLEDCDCRYCQYYEGLGKNKHCVSKLCVCFDEIDDALEHGRIFRKKRPSKMIIMEEVYDG